ncbi:hypothetical protein DM860_008746 [Cuscuta australis]|uniref:alcohol dehydrogenase n=1 Tax=Cuscuta australis TaxID=267555 RepID=A0A328D9E0_9ASTE|nr:hypothetical protein DM860_008746 [Cuscuta australis]
MDNPIIVPEGTAGKVIKCKAAVAWRPWEPLTIQEVEVAPPQKLEVRVKILFTSLCSGDVLAWVSEGPLFPRILGHEATGVVESVGEGVTEVIPGDKVMMVYTGECGECAHCKSEESNLCSLLRHKTNKGVMIQDNTSRFSTEGTPIYHFAGTSTFVEYTVVHAGCVVKLNPLAPLEMVCALSCGVVAGLGSVLNVAKPKEGSSVAIFGLGVTGLAAAEGARIAGAARIIGIDEDPNRRARAPDFGVNCTLNPSLYTVAIKDVIGGMTGGGVDRSIECSGDPRYILSAFDCLHTGWGVAVLNVVSRTGDEFRTDPMNFMGEKTLKGCFFGNYKPRSHLPLLVDMIMNQELDLAKFVTYRFTFDEIKEAFKLYEDGEDVLICIIRMGE